MQEERFGLLPRDFAVAAVGVAQQGALEARRAVAHLYFGHGQRGDAATAERAFGITENAHRAAADETDPRAHRRGAHFAGGADIGVFVIAVLQGRNPGPVLRPDGNVVEPLPDHRSRQRTHGGPADEFQKASSVKHWRLLTCGRQSRRYWHWCCQGDWDQRDMPHTATSSWCSGCSP